MWPIPLDVYTISLVTFLENIRYREVDLFLPQGFFYIQNICIRVYNIISKIIWIFKILNHSNNHKIP